MTKAGKLRICNWSLLVTLFPLTISSILLEYLGGETLCGVDFSVFVWLHVLFAVILFGLVGYHFYLHFGTNGWRLKISKLKSGVTRNLIKIAALMLVLSLAAVIAYCIVGKHTTLGGIHGKIGFLFLIVAIGHTIKRKAWFSRKKNQ